jgi:hypothetical protein
LTISDAHRDSYQATVSEFTRQSQEDTCLPVAIFNILSELRERHESFDPELDLDDLLDYCDHKPGFGSSAEYLPDRLAPVLEEYNYTITIETGLDLADLEAILQEESSSYPVVELDPQYFEHAEGYTVQTGQFAKALPHTVIPYRFNSEVVLYFDPYEDFYAADPDSGAPPREMTQVQFYELWSGKAEPQWTLWVERSEQQTFEEYTEET